MIKTSSSQHEILYYDPEIERTLRRIRKEKQKIQVDLEFNLEKLFEEEKGMVKNLATQIGQVHNQGVQYQQKTDTHLQNIDTQIGQICTSLSNLESQLSGKLPSQPHPKPKE
ncbi:Dynein regulatory complex protein 9 [Bienertia sinuspersici]